MKICNGRVFSADVSGGRCSLRRPRKLGRLAWLRGLSHERRRRGTNHEMSRGFRGQSHGSNRGMSRAMSRGLSRSMRRRCLRRESRRRSSARNQGQSPGRNRDRSRSMRRRDRSHRRGTIHRRATIRRHAMIRHRGMIRRHGMIRRRGTIRRPVSRRVSRRRGASHRVLENPIGPSFKFMETQRHTMHRTSSGSRSLKLYSPVLCVPFVVGSIFIRGSFRTCPSTVESVSPICIAPMRL